MDGMDGCVCGAGTVGSDGEESPLFSDEHDDAGAVAQPRVYLRELLPGEGARWLLTWGHALLPLGSGAFTRKSLPVP